MRRGERQRRIGFPTTARAIRGVALAAASPGRGVVGRRANAEPEILLAIVTVREMARRHDVG